MKQADFYILPCTDDDGRTEFLCKLVTRILSASHEIYIVCEDEYSMQRLSDSLWNYKDTSFLANTTANEQTIASISIGYSLEHKPPHKDVLINLASTIPNQAEGFDRVVEIVIQQPEILERSRIRYKDYRNQGFTIKNNDMRGKTTTGN